MRYALTLLIPVLLLGLGFGCGENGGTPPKGTLLVVRGVKTARQDLGGLVELRRRQGWRVEVREVRQPTSQQLRSLIADEKAKDASLSHVLLVGSDCTLPMARLPNYRTQKAEGDWAVLTDDVYGLPDAAGVPELAVGRFPTEEREELRRLVSKTVQYENALASLLPEVFLLTGRQPAYEKAILGVISPQGLVDRTSSAFVEALRQKLARNLIMRARTAFPGPDHYPFEESLNVFRTGLSGRPVMSIYAGHGDRNAFATFHNSEQRFGITREHMAKLGRCDVSGPFLSGACATLEPEGQDNSLGKEILLLSGGPVSVVGYTRVNDDFCVMQLFEILTEEMCKPRDCTLGELVLRVKQRMVEEPATPRALMVQTLMVTSGVMVLQAHELDYLAAIRKNNALLTIYGDPTVTVVIPPES